MSYIELGDIKAHGTHFVACDIGIITFCRHLLKTVEELNTDLLKLYKTGNPSIFGNFLNKTMGFTTS